MATASFTRLAAGLLAAGITLFAAFSIAKGQDEMAPELEPNLGWLNTDKPLRFREELKGHVVVLDFWTLCCINCIHILPDLEYLEKKYANDPVVVIGVHSAKFTNEAERQSIRHAIFRYHIEHPVVIDKDFAIWRRYGARGWPTFVVIGPDGRLVGATSGEGNRELLDQAIRQALDEGKSKGTLAAKKVEIKLDAAVPSAAGLSYPGKVHAVAPTDGAPGALFIADSSHHRIVIASWPDESGRSVVRRVVGGPGAGFVDGPADQARFNDPQGLAFDPKTRILFVADRKNHTVRAINLRTYDVMTIAGDGTQGSDRGGGKAGREQRLNSPWDVLLNPDGKTLHVAMAGTHQLWNIDLPTGIAARLAGSGGEDIDDGPARRATLAQPSGLALSRDGSRLYFADSEVSAIRYFHTQKEEVATLIGEGLFEYGDIDGAYPTARLQHCLGVAMLDTPEGERVLIADTYNHKLKLLDPGTRTVTTWLGVARAARTAEDQLRLDEPAGLCVARAPGGEQTIFVADTNQHRIVMIDAATKAWREVMVEGLAPPTEPRNWSALAAAAKPAALRAVPGKPIMLNLSPALPAGAKLNPEAPASVLVTLLRDGAEPRTILQRTLRADALPIAVTLEADTAPPGSRLLVELSYATCTTDLSTCMPGEANWIVTSEPGQETTLELR